MFSCVYFEGPPLKITHKGLRLAQSTIQVPMPSLEFNIQKNLQKHQQHSKIKLRNYITRLDLRCPK